MNGTMEVAFGMAGGLALFLYGMNSMSDALQKAAGERMKSILSFLTKNPVMGALAGALVTAVLQSSSATTVMAIGFVSAGLMSLPQAISVIFGANVGTTMTAQLLAFQISDYIYPIIFIGFLMNFAGKSEKLKNVGLVIFSFGLLFEGIEMMGSVMKPLAGSPFFINLIGKVSQIPILGVLVGLFMTLVVQSSSATIAVLQNFASQAGPDGVSSVIGLAGAIPILLGDNIGTTITALLASIGQSKNAKRTAVAHSVFNITGSIVFLFMIPVLTAFVQMISPKGPEVAVISRQIANAHTTFNVVCTLVWLPLIAVMVKIVKLIIPGEDQNENQAFQAKFLDEKVIGQPVAAMYLVSQELNRGAELAEEMLDLAKESLTGTNRKEARMEFAGSCSALERLQKNISQYLTKMLSSGAMTEIQAEKTAGLLSVSNNLERITERCSDILQIVEKVQNENRQISDEAVGELKNCFAILNYLFEHAMEAVRTGDWEAARKVSRSKNKMRKAQKQFTKAHMARVKKNLCDSSMLEDFSNLLYNLDRIADNCVSIAEEALDDVIFVNLEEMHKEEGTV